MADSYPLRFDVEYPEELSRWLMFVKLILVVPHWIILYALSSVSQVMIAIAFFAIVFTKRFPRGLFDFVVGINRWNCNVGAYMGLQRDEYPPFSWASGEYPLTYEVDYPEQLNRWRPFVHWLLLLPHFILLLALYSVALVVYPIVFLAILFTKRFPRGLFDFMVGIGRWGSRVSAYSACLTDKYPPFSLR